jgi:heat shock protein HtpX
MAGIISSLGDIFLFGSIFGGNREERNPIASLLFIMLAPIMALLIQLAVSRSREYVADSTAARFTGEPQHLANALMKISTVAKQMPMQTNPALASLYIESPVRMSGIAELFSTHPNIDKRINRLLNLNY